MNGRERYALSRSLLARRQVVALGMVNAQPVRHDLRDPACEASRGSTVVGARCPVCNP